ncbi:hypothetical protein ABPG75_006681 [Micractinium tetrahymenae]
MPPSLSFSETLAFHTFPNQNRERPGGAEVAATWNRAILQRRGAHGRLQAPSQVRHSRTPRSSGTALKAGGGQCLSNRAVTLAALPPQYSTSAALPPAALQAPPCLQARELSSGRIASRWAWAGGT